MFTLLSLHVNMWSFYLRYEKIPEEWEPPKPKPYHDVVSILKLSNYKCQWILEYSVLEHCSSFQIFNYSNLDAVNILLNSFYFKISFQYKPMFHWLWVFFFFLNLGKSALLLARTRLLWSVQCYLWWRRENSHLQEHCQGTCAYWRTSSKLLLLSGNFQLFSSF